MTSAASRRRAAQPVIPSSKRMRRAQDLLRVLVADEHGHEHGLRLVRLVDRQRVVRDEVGERVGDAHEQRVEALLGEHLVEDVGEPPVRLDELGRLGRTVTLRQKPEMRLGAGYQGARRRCGRARAAG